MIKRWLAVASALICMLLVAPAAIAQNDDTIQILSVDSSDLPSVELTVSIPPEFGEVPPSADFFAVTQSGTRRTIAVESLRDSVDVVLVIDTSGSMRGGPLDAAKAAATEFVRQLPDGARIGVIGFGESPVIASEMGTDRAELASAIAGLSAAGETALWEAIEAAAALLESSRADQPYVVVMSDGGNTVPSATQRSARGALTELGAPLYAVALQTDEANHGELRSTVRSVGGQFLTTEETGELAALYSEVAGRLVSRYSVTFNAAGSGTSEAILTVAINDRIALARTTLELGGTADASASDAPAAPASLPTADVPAELGVITLPDARLSAHPLVLWLGAGSFFVAAFMTVLSFTKPGLRNRGINLGRSEGASRVDGLKDGLTRSATQLVAQRDREGKFDLALDSAGMNIRAGEYVVVVAAITLGAALFGSASSGLSGALLFGIATVVGAVVFIRVKITRRRAAFSDQLSDTITILVGALRSGRGFPQALELVAQEAQRPTSEEFRRVVVESRVGRDQIDSLEAMSRRMDNADLEWIAQAVAINRELGGDLVEVLENVDETIRSRTRVARQVRALSAEGRISGWLMVSMPFLMFLYMRAVNPEYIDPLTSTSSGLIAILVGLVLIVMGAVWIRKLIDLKY